jgi:hypothetical protein
VHRVGLFLHGGKSMGMFPDVREMIQDHKKNMANQATIDSCENTGCPKKQCGCGDHPCGDEYVDRRPEAAYHSLWEGIS